MATNLAIDDELLNMAKKIGKHKTKKEAVNTALAEYIRHQQQLKALDLFGQIEMDEDYNHKKGRHRNENLG